MPPNGDWLVFEVTGEIPKNVAIYKLKETPLEKGETVYFLGYPYKSTEPLRVKGSYIGLTEDQQSLNLDIPQGRYNGCSGGPVFDEKGKLVGLVSMGYFDEDTNKMIFEPAPISYFKKVMDLAKTK